MFVLFFIFSLVVTCCSLPNANLQDDKKRLTTSTTSEPKNINEVKEQMKKYLEEKCSDPFYRNILSDFHAEWCVKAKVAETILNNNLRQEKKLRILFQSLMNIGEWIESLFDECWPHWTGLRSPKNYTREHWTLLLLNIEHSKILNLKMQLTKLKISDDFFIKTVEELLKFRNRDAHKIMYDNEKDEAVELFNEQYKGDNKPHVVEILMLGLNERILTIKDEMEISELHHKVNAITREQRKSFRVLQLPKCKSPEYSEDDIEEVLTQVANEYRSEANDENDVITPLAIIVTTNGAYALFQDFEEAFFIWNKRNEMQLVWGHADGIKIINASNPFI
ncbi:uncharacterized protein LOC135844807 [Planococcus citri]|uniref:uncharacterized protein LOC135844807 n=1 Tax=Planococcus citri TaxID=170843 RepID=UPI0031F8ADB7